MKSKEIICCVAGRSGGHIIPCMTIAQTRTESSNILFFTSDYPLDKEILRKYPELYQHVSLHLMNVPRWWRMPLFGVQAIYTFFKSLIILARTRPTTVISTGGYIAIPVCCAAYILRIPIELYELNAVPGKAAYVIARIASRIVVCFKKTESCFQQPTYVEPYPVRFAQENHSLIKKPEELLPNYTPHKKTILILGGSQGSDFLNQQLCQFIFLAGGAFQIIHQTGKTHISLLTELYRQQNISAVVFAYQQDLEQYYLLADIIICRAGAGTLFETLFFKKPCITIPLETVSTDHQLDNAYALRDEHPELIVVLRQQALLNDPGLLFTTVSHLLDQPR